MYALRYIRYTYVYIYVFIYVHRRVGEKVALCRCKRMNFYDYMHTNTLTCINKNTHRYTVFCLLKQKLAREKKEGNLQSQRILNELN